MLNRASFENSVARLNETLSRRYGCQIDFVPPHLRTNPSRESELIGDTLYIPLFVDNIFRGSAKITQSNKINPEYRKGLIEFISTIFVSRLEGQNSTPALLEPEVTPFAHQGHSNVVTLRPRRKTEAPTIINKLNNESPFTFSFLIQSADPEDVFKMALEIHERTHRLMLVRIEDLDDSAFASVEAIESLGNVTIFAADITRVPHARQKKLIQFFEKAQPSRELPQFIAGTSLGRQDLRNDPRVYNALIPAISRGYLHLTQPFSFYRNEKLLEFFFDSLTDQYEDQ